MSFPLIQQPAPLQQLADTINAIRARREAATQAQFEREQGKAQMIRSDAYLALNQEEAANAQKQREMSNAIAQGQLALDQAKTAATIQNMAAERIQRQQQLKQGLVEMILRNAPPGFTVSLGRAQQEAAGNRYLPGTGQPTPSLDQQYQTLPGRARAGLQGSAIRQAVPVTENGVTYTPPTLNYNQPTPTLGGERAQLRGANLEALVGITNTLHEAERENPVNAQRPWSSVVGGVLAGAVRKIGGERTDPLAQAAENLGLNNAQTEYQGGEEQWVHNYLPNLPGFRMSVPMFNSAKRAFFPPPGETNPEVVATYTARREAVVRALVSAQQNGETAQQMAARIAGQLRAFGARDVATGIEQAVRGPSASGPQRRTDNGAPYVDPRLVPQP